MMESPLEPPKFGRNLLPSTQTRTYVSFPFQTTAIVALALILKIC